MPRIKAPTGQVAYLPEKHYRYARCHTVGARLFILEFSDSAPYLLRRAKAEHYFVIDTETGEAMS